jgi:hypothetical protein
VTFDPAASRGQHSRGRPRYSQRRRGRSGVGPIPLFLKIEHARNPGFVITNSTARWEQAVDDLQDDLDDVVEGRRNSRATWVFVRPRAHANTSRARCANACAVVGRRAQRSSASRSSSVNVNIGMGRPMDMSVLLSIARTLGAYTLFYLFQTHETREHRDGSVRGPNGPRGGGPGREGSMNMRVP